MKTMPQPLTAGLAKRLAEAADGFRDCKYYYFISKSDYDFDLQYASGDSDNEALTFANIIKSDKGDDYEIYGPYKTESNDPPLMNYDSIKLSLNNGELDSINIVLEKDTDAIILSLSAYDKFFHPYFTRLYGNVVANNLRSDASAALSSKVPVRHGNATALRTNIVIPPPQEQSSNAQSKP